MTDVRLTNDQWMKIRDFLRQDPKAYVGNEAKSCRFVETVKQTSRSSAQWRLLPAEYGNWNSLYKRFARWSDQGVRQWMLEYYADEPDVENDSGGQHHGARLHQHCRSHKKRRPG